MITEYGKTGPGTAFMVPYCWFRVRNRDSRGNLGTYVSAAWLPCTARKESHKYGLSLFSKGGTIGCIL